jgi:hypothetical protein
MVATTVFVIAVVGLASLFVLATRATSGARTMTYAAILAQEKMEQLRALVWGFDALGQPLSDPGLSPSPGGALASNTSSYCDFLDANGRRLGEGATPPPNTAFVRRWSIDPVPTSPDNAVVIQIVVIPLRERTVNLRGAHVVSVKTRKAT